MSHSPSMSDSSTMTRVLSKPSTPHANNGRDNENDDLILRVNDELGARVSSGPMGRHGRENFEAHDDDEGAATYRIMDSLGSGTFGQVVACESSVDGKTRALKVIKNHPAYFHQAHVEIGILRTLNTRCADKPASGVIVELLDYFICHNHLTLVFELLGMNLYELLRKNKFKGLHLGAIRGMMKQLLGALDVLRDAHVVHCDIKPENILLTSNNSFQVKLVDFGSACFQNRTVYQYIQSRFYRSPEVFLGMPYGMPIDMWSLGCVAAELFLGLPIFPGSSEYDLLARICETIGTPPSDMLSKAPNANKFFTRVDIGFDESSSSLNSGATSRYKLFSLREYESRTGKRTAMGKKYFKYTEFSDIIASVPYQSSCVDQSDANAVEEEKKARMVERSSFYDLLTGMMEIDPNHRWTPAQALQHPFITNEPFDAPYTPEHIPERTTPQEREVLQRVAAKEAALVSAGSPAKKKKIKQPPIAEEPPTPVTPTPVGPPAIPVGGLAAALAASSSGSTPPMQVVSPNVVNPIVAEAFTGAMLQAQAAAHAHAAAAVAAMSPAGIPMSPGGGLGGGYPPFVVGSANTLSSSYNSSSLLASSFIGSPHALNSAALHPLHFGVSPPTSAMSNMGLSTSQQTRAAQAATAVQLPPASPLSRGTSFLARGMNGATSQRFQQFGGAGSSYSGNVSHFGRSSSRENLKTVQETVVADSPPPNSPSPMEDDHAEGADWDPTFGEMLDEEHLAEARTNGHNATAPQQITVPGLNRAAKLPPQPYQSIVGFPASSSVPTFSQSPNSAFGVSPTSAGKANQVIKKQMTPTSDKTST